MKVINRTVSFLSISIQIILSKYMKDELVQDKRNEMRELFTREKTVIEVAIWAIKRDTIFTSGNHDSSLATHEKKSFDNYKLN